jgi:hypothetical protein
MRRPGLLAWTAIAVLLALLGAFVQGELTHTDDGCAVEVHCNSCRWAATANVVFAIVPLPTLHLERTIAPPALRLPAPPEPDTDVPATRGPPA